MIPAEPSLTTDTPVTRQGIHVTKRVWTYELNLLQLFFAEIMIRMI